jgi:hypothetical protein
MQNSSEDIPVRYRWGLGASVILHLLLIAVLLFGVPDVFPPEEEQSIHVELVEPEEKAPEPAPSPEQVSEPETSQVEEPASEQIQEQKPQAFESAAPEDDKPQPEEPVETTPTEEPQTQTETAEDKVAESKEEAVTLQPVKSDPELKKAKEIHSKDMLSDPRVKQAIGKLPMKDRMVQVCSIEALEQIRRQKAGAFPDILAPIGSETQGTRFEVKNGAFRSQGKWYEVRFQCQVNADAMSIQEFRYNIGQAIPESEWQARDLPRD